MEIIEAKYLSSPDRPCDTRGTCVITVHYTGIVHGGVSISGDADALSCVEVAHR